MIVIKNKRYIKKYRVGGAGIFDTLLYFSERLMTSNVVKSVATNLSKAAASDIGKSAINAGKTVGKELAASLVSAAKDAAIEKGKQLINRTPEPVGTQRSKDILQSLVSNGSGMQAVRIEDLVRRLNNGGG